MWNTVVMGYGSKVEEERAKRRAAQGKSKFVSELLDTVGCLSNICQGND